MVSVAGKYCYIPGGCCHLRIAQAPRMSLTVIRVRRKRRRGAKSRRQPIGNFLRGLTSTEYSAENAA